LGEPELYVIYEFASETAPDEVRVIYDKGLLNVLWPLPEGRCRWSFQWPQADEDEFPHKDRRAVWFEDRIIAERTREHLQQLLRDRVPWFAGSDPTQVEWAADAQFERCLAARFGQGRCWLAGDAAHQTGPVGMQSMNVGLREGALLAGLMKRILRDGESTGLLETYGRERRDEWRQLLGATGRLLSAEQAASHLDYPSARLLSCIPGSEGDLSAMLRPLGFDFPAVYR
jgi:2-polyprenyl-6-methoxyphenol hydroxylase-like FAD-dependent oxidoreductase